MVSETPHRSRRILIFGINYEPEQLGIAPYTTGLAEHLASSGNDVTVVTGFPHYPEWKLTADHRRKRAVTETVNGVRIVRRRHFVPSSPTTVNRGLYELSFLTHGLSSLVSVKPDLILGVSPSVSGATLAAAASTRYGVPFGIWFQDLCGRAACQSGIAGGNRVGTLVDNLEALCARRAAAIGVIAGGFRSHLTQSASIPPASAPFATGAISPNQPSPNPKLAAGSICPRTPSSASTPATWARSRASKTSSTPPSSPQRNPTPRFSSCRATATPAALERRASGFPNLRFPLPQPEADFPNTLAAADVLLVNQKPSVTDMCLPGKLTSYFAANRPVIAAVNPSSETAAELRGANTALLVPAGEPGAILQAIDHLRTNPSLGIELAQNALHFAETELSAASAFAAIDDFIDQITAGHAQGAGDPAHAGVAD